jgi:heme/copper-type cytochrome/quinol oxidase subunit 4
MSGQSEESARLALMGKWATRVLLAAGTVLVVLEFVIHRHGEIAAEDIPLFPAVYAFVICVAIVVGGIWLRKIAMRDEDYYDDE